ncbi:MAG: glycosyltransferase family 4 protein [Chloroflexota bacterium]|nr:glycosyltransferase family 4 protein [Chloroflexota bacterium]
MNILAVTSTPPWPPTHGAAVRNSLLLEALTSEHTVDLVTLDAPGTPAVPAPPGVRRVIQIRAAPPTVWRRLRAGWRGGVPDLLVRHGSRTLRGRVQLLLGRGEYGAVHVAQAQMAPVVRDVWTATPRRVRRPRAVYDAHNIEWTLQQGLARASGGLRARWGRRQAALLRRVEAWLARTADLALAASPDDRASLAALGAREPEYVPHPVRLGAACPGAEDRAEHPRVLFAANFAYRPNVMAAEWLFGQVWPGVARQVPKAELRVVGPQSEQLRPIASAQTTLGGVVDDVDLEYRRAWIAVSPTSVAAGAPYKVLSALAAGRPVVARAQGYVGLPADEGIGVTLPERASDFVSAVTKLLTDPAAHDRAASAGFAYVKREHDASIVGQQLQRAYARICAPATSGSTS